MAQGGSEAQAELAQDRCAQTVRTMERAEHHGPYHKASNGTSELAWGGTHIRVQIVPDLLIGPDRIPKLCQLCLKFS